MDSFEANKIFGALLGTVFVLFGGSLLAEGIFHSELPEKPGFAIEAAEPQAGGAAAPAANEVTPVAQIMASADPEAGAAIFKRCQACHSGEKGGPNKVGPDLWDVVNRPIAAHEGFSYSTAMKEFSENGSVHWDWDHLNHFLHGPKQYIKGTAMGFAGLPKDQERADLLAYLRTLSDNPAPLPQPEEEAAAQPAGETEGSQPAAETSPATTTAPTTPGDAVSSPQGGGTVDPDTGSAPVAPPSQQTPATGDNATNPPAEAPTPPASQPQTEAPASSTPAPAPQ